MSETPKSRTTISELSSIVPQLARILGEIVQADRCAIFVYSEDQESTIALFRHGYDDDGILAHSWTDAQSPQDVAAERFNLETKQPLHRTAPEDFERYPLLNAGQERLEGRLVDLSVPLIWNGRVQGSACVWRKDDPRPFTDHEIRRVMDTGRLTAMAVVFARHYHKERLQRQRLDALVHVSSVTVTSHSFDNVLETLIEAVRSTTEADVCALYVFDESDLEVISSVQVGMGPDELEMFRVSALVTFDQVPAEVRIRRTLEPMIVRDFERELAANSAFTRHAVQTRISEVLLLPVTWQSQVVGVIYCWFRAADQRFSMASIDSGEAIASQAGGLVARTRLEEMIRRQTAESEALMRIGEAVLKSETINPVLDEIARSLQHLIPFDYASFGMLTPDGAAIRVTREWGDSFTPVIGTLIPVDASISGESIRQRRAVSSHQVREDPRAWENIPPGAPLQSVLSAPLIFDNRTFGNIMMARRSTYRFSSREMQLLQVICQQAAVAIERVHSREEMAHQAEQQAFLARVGDLLVASENPESELQRIADMAAGMISDGVIIGLAGWEFGSLRWVADAFNDPEMAGRLHRGLHFLDLDLLRERLEFALVSNRELSFPISNIWDEHRFLREFLESLGVTSMLVIPLFQRERAPGLVMLLSQSDVSSFREDDVQLARLTAQRIGDALERQQVKRNHEGLLRVSEAFHSESRLDHLISTIAVELGRILPCTELIIADFLPEENVLHTQVYRLNGVEHPGVEYFSAEEGLCGESVALKRPIMDNQADLRNTSVYGGETARVFYRREGESALVSPLIVEDKVVGTIFTNRIGHNRFTQADFETFMLFAGLASAALDRTMLEQSSHELYRASTEVLAAVVDAKDPMTLKHSRHVASYSRMLAEAMNLMPDDVEHIELAGLLHDVGKLGIPDRVLQKPGRLTDEEFALIKTHPQRGATILERHPALANIIPMVRHHHEKIDGKGYPDGLSGDDIPIGAAIICVADAFDTMTSERTYQRRRSVEEAIAELQRCAGSQFHPELVSRFIKEIEANPDLIQVDRDSG